MFLDAPFHCLESLYQWCNNRYFEGTLLPASISWSRRLKNSFGFFEWTSDSGKTGPRIVLSERLKGCPSEILDTIVHEMIHVWQYQKYASTKNIDFLDIKPSQGHSFHSSWHGEYFYRWVNHLNVKFEELNLGPEKEGFPTDIGLVVKEKQTVLIRFSINDHPEEALFVADCDLSSKLETLISDAMDLYGVDCLKSVSISKTKSPDVDLFPRLSRCGRFRANQNPQSHDPELIDRVLSHLLTDVPEVVYQSEEVPKAPIMGRTDAPGISENAFAKPLYLLLGHASTRINGLDGNNHVYKGMIQQRWFDFPVEAALGTPNGRNLLESLVSDIMNDETHALSSFAHFWHSLGPGRYEPCKVLKAILSSNVISQVCAQRFLSVEAFKARLNSIDTGYLLSTFYQFGMLE